MSDREIELMLLFTYGGRLEVWEQQGLIDRELGYYERMFDSGLRSVYLMTYGNGIIKKKIDHRFKVLTKKWFNHELLYSFVAVFSHWRGFKKITIMKTNQSRGAWVGLIAKVFFPKKKLIVRCGWVRTEQMMKRDEGLSGINLMFHKFVEWLGFFFSDRIIVVTPANKDYVVSRYRISPKKVAIIPNSVDTSIYYPLKINSKSEGGISVLMVGRLVEMKNFHGALNALSQVEGVSDITIIGGGPYKGTLEALANDLSLSVCFLESIPNHEIPSYLRSADLFLLPQFYASGMPKVLLEAMACGVLTLSSDIDTHRQVIDHEKNGLLCNVEAEGVLAESIRGVVEMSSSAYNTMIEKALDNVQSSYSMESNSKKEYLMYKELLLN